MKKTRSLALLICFILVMSIIVGCSSKETEQTTTTTTKTDTGTTGATTTTAAKEIDWTDEKIELTEMCLAGWYEENGTRRPIAEEFMKKYPNVTIKWNNLGNNQTYREKAALMAAGGTLDDIIFAGVNTEAPQLAKSGGLRNLEPLIDEEWKSWYGNNFEGLRSADGVIYVISVDMFTLGGLHVRRDLFEKVDLEYPKTLSDLKNCVKVFNENGIIPWSLGAKDPYYVSWFSGDFMNKYENNNDYGKKILAGEAKFADNEGYVKALDHLLELKAMGAFNKDVSNIPYEQGQALFFDGKSAMFVDGSWIYSTAKSLGISDEVLAQIDFIPFPEMEDSTFPQNKLSVAIGGGLCLNSKLEGNKLKAALAYLRNLCTPETGVYFQTIGLTTPFNHPVDEALVGPLFPQYYKVMENCTSYRAPFDFYPQAFAQSFYKLLGEHFNGVINTVEFLQKCDEAFAVYQAEQ